MRNLISMDTIQIEICNVCNKSCANCTRFCSHVSKPYFMEFDEFKVAVDSMVGYPKMTGIQGGEPLLHPYFEKMCEYLSSKINPEQLGLWTTLPKGYEHYREIIVKTFKHIFINDHSRSDIYHHPPLVAIEEVIPDKNLMWGFIDKCWAQEWWSASINPRGAWFCEMAASLSMLFEEGEGWKIEPGWWYRIPKDFTSQMEQFCPRCGMAASLRRRASIENVDDISSNNYLKLKDKVRNSNRFIISDCKIVKDPEPLAAYKNFDYRNSIAKSYGMFLVINSKNFWTPYLYKSWSKG